MAQDPIPAGDLMDEKVLFEYAIYFSKENVKSKSEVENWIKQKYPQFEILNSLHEPEKVKATQLVLFEVENVKTDYTAPDVGYLKYSGRGLDAQQKELIQKSESVLLFFFMYEKDKMISAIRDANQMMSDLCENDKNFIWDEETRECFTKDYWDEYRLIDGKEINITEQFTIHMYQNSDYCRAISLGMMKFGLPDICIEEISCNSSGSMASLINLTAQTIFENPVVKKDGRLPLDINKIHNKELKNQLLNTLEENAKKKAEIKIVTGVAEEGDPDNSLIEIAFSADNPQVEHGELLTTIFGSFDEVTQVNHDKELLAASEAARDKIPQLYKKFSKGLEVGTHLLVKFPFENEEGYREWMWVEVVKWKDDTVYGLLQNDPQVVTSLKSGQEVTNDINDMFDYIIYFPDGSQEGNETGKIMSRQR